MNIGPRIKAFREEMGLTQQECAESAGMSQSMWADIEADRGNPTLDTLERVAGALGVTLADLLSQ